MKMMLRKVCALVILIGFMVVCGSQTTSGAAVRAAKGVVTIGVNDSEAGADASFGVAMADGVEYAAKQIDAAGGFEVDGKTYTIAVDNLNDNGDTAQAVADEDQLVKDDGVKYIFGPTLPTLAVPALAIAGPAHVIQFAPSTEGLVEGGFVTGNKSPTIFATQLSAATMAKYQTQGVQLLGAKSVTILTSDDSTSATDDPPVIKAFKAAGLKVSVVLVPDSATDYTPYLTRVKADNSQVLFYWNPQANTAEVVQDAVQLGVAPKGIVTRNGAPQIALSQAIGHPISVPFVGTNTDPSYAYPPNKAVAAFVKGMTKFAPSLPAATANFVFFGSPFLDMLVQAMKDTGTVSNTLKISSQLSKMTYDSVIGPLCFKPGDRIAQNDASQTIVRDGKVKSVIAQSTCPA